MGCLFILLMVSFDVQKFFILMKSTIFSFAAYAFGAMSKKSLANPVSLSFSPMVFFLEFYI